jgi:HK97 family phage prohead protease
MNIERKTIDVAAEFKATEAGDGNGSLAGYASIFGDLDSCGDIVMPGAYADTLPAFIKDGWLGSDHNWDFEDQVGYWTAAREDDKGLYVEAAFYSTDDAQAVRQIVTERLAAGKSVKLSIGYVVEAFEMVSGADARKYLRDPAQGAQLDPARQYRLLKKISLYEVSVVSVPALASAVVTGAKSDQDMAHAAMPFADQLQKALAACEDTKRRAIAINELRVKEGRTLSTANRERLASMLEAMKACMADVQELLDATEPAKAAELEADSKAAEQSAAHTALDQLLAELAIEEIRQSL